jgi:hypothetical protein
LLLIVYLASPLLFTNAYFAPDWLLHLWYIWHQGVAIQDNHLPSLFFNYFHQVYYPQYAFYGGTLYALAGTLSVLLGGAPLATYILAYCLGFLAAYGGWYWMARGVGLDRWQSHVPGLVFITSASYITMIYGRGDWPEFIAISVIPLLLAAGLSVLRSDRKRFWPTLALAIAAVLFFGSHSMTLLWASTFLTLVGLAVVLCIPQARSELTRRRVLRVAGIVIPALLVSAWFLLPALAYQSHTWAGSGYGEGAHAWEVWLRLSIPWVRASHLFALTRTESRPGSSLYFMLPVLVIAWIIASVALLLRGGARGPWVRVFVILAGMALLAGLLMTHAGLIELLPHPYLILVYSYRLDSYVLLGLCGALLAVLVLVKQADARRVRPLLWILIPVLLVSLIGAAQQISTVRDNGGRETVLSSYLSPVLPGQTAPLLLEDYVNILPVVKPSRPSAAVLFPPASIRDDRASAKAHFYPGERVNSNIGAGPELVHITGARIVGRNEERNDILEIAPQPGARARGASSKPTETISVSPAGSWPIVLGRGLTLLGVALLAAQLIAFAVPRRAKP